MSRRIIFRLVIFSVVYFSPIAWQFTIGAVLSVRAYQGDAKAMYDLARWHESHSGKITVLIPYWNRPNINDGFKWLHRHGQRTLSSFSAKDLHQEVVVPAAHATLHGKAVFAWMLLQQRQSEPSEPRQVLGNRTLASS